MRRAWRFLKRVVLTLAKAVGVVVGIVIVAVLISRLSDLIVSKVDGVLGSGTSALFALATFVVVVVLFAFHEEFGGG